MGFFLKGGFASPIPNPPPFTSGLGTGNGGVKKAIHTHNYCYSVNSAIMCA